MPERINLVEVRTVWGYRTFELYQGDITQLHDVDILVVSAFTHAYEPLPGTVIGSLAQIGIDVGHLAHHPLLDLRTPLHCWVSQKLTNQPFQHIVCVETPFDSCPGLAADDTADQVIRQALTDLFTTLLMLEARAIPTGTIATPMLATGVQDYDARTVIQALLDLSTRHLLHSSTTSTIKFVAFSPSRATELRLAMDDILGRVQVQLPKGDHVDAVKRDILRLLAELRKTVQVPVFDQVEQLARDTADPPLTYGITGRDFAEACVDDILGSSDSKDDLNRKINRLQKPVADVPEWLRSQLHVLRTIGNAFAHGQAQKSSSGMMICPEDMELQLMCIRRMLTFWIAYRQKQ